MTNWMTRWLPWQQRRTPHRSAAPRWMPEVGELVPAPEDATDEVVGCGWFDSSWDLQRGLAVLEGPVIDPLGLWTFERSVSRGVSCSQSARTAAAA